MPEIEIMVKEVGQGRFDALHNGRVIVQRSKTPFFDAARVMAARGIDAHEALVMVRSDGSRSLKSTVGAAAHLSVREDSRQPRFVRWRPSPHNPHNQ